MEEDIILQVEALSSQMIDDIKKIVRCPSVEGEALPMAPFGKDIAMTLDETLKIAEKLG